MIRTVRQLVGAALALAGVVIPAWAVFHLFREGSCGNPGEVACPDELGWWIMGLVGSYCLLLPLGVLLAGKDRATGRPLLLGPVIALGGTALVAGVVYSFLGSSANPDTRWVGYVVGGIAAVILIPVILGVIGGLSRSTVSAPKIALTPHPVDTAETAALDQMAALAATLQQVRTAKPKPKASTAAKTDLAERLKTLDDLHASGLIDDAEHRRRRDEILAEI